MLIVDPFGVQVPPGGAGLPPPVQAFVVSTQRPAVQVYTPVPFGHAGAVVVVVVVGTAHAVVTIVPTVPLLHADAGIGQLEQHRHPLVVRFQ